MPYVTESELSNLQLDLLASEDRVEELQRRLRYISIHSTDEVSRHYAARGLPADFSVQFRNTQK